MQDAGYGMQDAGCRSGNRNQKSENRRHQKFCGFFNTEFQELFIMYKYIMYKYVTL